MKRIENKIKNIINKIKKLLNHDKDLFYIHKVEPRYATIGTKILIFGKGFDNKNVSYDIKIKEQKLSVTIIDDTAIEVIIPDTLSEGTYDITAELKSNKNLEENMGLAIHITK